MSARRVRFSGARGAGVGLLLTGLALSSGALAQTSPPPNAPPPAAPPAAAPPPDGAAPTPGGEPPPALADSPLVQDQAPPPPPSYEDTAVAPPLPEEAPPPPRRSAGPFARGSVRLSFLIGTGSSVTDTYLILGAGAGYYLLDGLEFGLDYEAWILAKPVFNRLSPGLRYVFHMVPVIKPYIGGFYRHTFVGEGIEDWNSLGARGGIYYAPPNGRVYVGGGAVYEHLLDCPSGLDCDDVYPEIFVGVSF